MVEPGREPKLPWVGSISELQVQPGSSQSCSVSSWLELVPVHCPALRMKSRGVKA